MPSDSRSHGRARLRRLGATLAMAALATAQAQAQREDAHAVLRGPDVHIIQGEARAYHEYRQDGVLELVRVVPETDADYYLIPAGDEGAEDAAAQDGRFLRSRWSRHEF